jgi:hypothetical protein
VTPSAFQENANLSLVGVALFRPVRPGCDGGESFRYKTPQKPLQETGRNETAEPISGQNRDLRSKIGLGGRVGGIL